MSTAAIPTPSLDTLNSRSVGTKFFLIFLLAVFMSIPALFVDTLTDQRAVARGATTTYDANGAPIPPHTVLGIKLAEPYHSITRSLKYVTLFLGLVFLTYFIFEVTNSKRVHPGQYALVGVAQIIFYLLLLSFTEHVGFDFAFLIAGSATVALFSLNTKWLFSSTALGLRALLIFTLLYAFIYVLLRLQDYALLVGSLASFAAVAATMYFTRSVNWYGSAAPLAAAASTSSRSSGSWLD